MKLSIRTNENREKKSNSKKVVNKTYKKKENKMFKVNKNYMDMKPFNVVNTNLNMKSITYGAIDSCKLNSIYIQNSKINFNKSWEELVVFLLHYLIYNNKSNFRQILADYSITNQEVIVDTTYGNYDLQNNNQYKVYKIYDSNLYIEAVFSPKNIFNIILGVLKYLEIQTDEIEFNITNKEYKDTRIDYSIESDNEEIVYTDMLKYYIKENRHMVSVNVFGNSTVVHDLDMALYVICYFVAMRYGDLELLKVKRYRNVGIITNTDNIENMEKLKITSMPINIGIVRLCTDNDVSSELGFLDNLVTYFKLSNEQLKFKFTKIEEKTFNK